MRLFSFFKFSRQKQISKPGSESPMDPVFDDIRVKLAELSRKDPGYTIFGASTHKYKRRPKLAETEIESFEHRYGIKLPADFRGFLMYLGNGGAGPFYGVEKLQDSIYFSLDYKNEEVNDPSQEFPFTEAWNLDFGEGEDTEEEDYSDERDNKYFDAKWSNGLLRVANFGCGVTINLVVNGKEYGNIWVDDRVNDGGIYPDQYFGNKKRITFLEWYELWLDKSLKELSK